MNLLGYFGDAVPWFLVLAPAVGLVTGVVSARRRPGAPARERRVTIALDVLIALCVLGVATITLLPRPPQLPGYAWGVQLVPFVSIVDLLADPVTSSIPTVAIRIIGMNIVLFVPLGGLLALRTDSLRTTVTIAAATSVLIEILQLLLPLGRTTNVDDVILNTIGAAIGAATVQITDEENPAKRVELVQRKLDCEDQLANLEDAPNLDALEEDFKAVVKEYSERKGLSYRAWREVGVPASALRDAGLSRGFNPDPS